MCTCIVCEYLPVLVLRRLFPPVPLPINAHSHKIGSPWHAYWQIYSTATVTVSYEVDLHVIIIYVA